MPRRVEPALVPPVLEMALIDATVLAEVPVEEDLPVVRESDDPAYEASQLSLAGFSWVEIAERTGFGSSALAAAAVSAHLQRQAILQSARVSQERVQQALARDEAVILAHWNGMLAGDKDDSMVVLKANAEWFKHAGLERNDIIVNSRQTILISGGPDMAAQLQRQIDLQDERMRLADEAMGIIEAEEVG